MGLFSRNKKIENYSETFKKYYEKKKIRKAKKLLEPWENEHPDDYNLYYAKTLILFEDAEKNVSQLDVIHQLMVDNNKKGYELSPHDYFNGDVSEIDKWFFDTAESREAGIALILMNR